MKKIHLLILQLFLYTNLVCAQSGTILYKTVLDFPTKDLAVDLQEMHSKVLQSVNSQEFILLFNDSKSFFDIKTKINETIEEEKYIFDVARSGFTSLNKVYLDKKTNSIYEIMPDGIVTKNSIANNKWEITAETKIIDIYTCYKAFYTIEFLTRNGSKNTRIVTAWFAPSLPYSYGPKTFNGLPGLILELTDKRTTYLATSLIINNNIIKIDLPKGKTITKEDYEAKLKAQMGM